MSGKTKSVAVLALEQGLSVTFIEDNDGWGFHHCDPPVAVRPTDVHRAMRFATMELAAQFFRNAYGGRARTG